MKSLFTVLLLSISLISFAQSTVSKIAFGSCSHQDKEQPILNEIIAEDPDLFIYVGDNIYADTKDMEIMKFKYDKLASKEEFQALRKATTVLATWDDHDYGEDDAGMEYAMKEASKNIFQDFWKVPKDDPSRKREGIYTSKIYGKEGKRVQVILLDTRTFRTPYWEAEMEVEGYPYRVTLDIRATMLGEAQWKWLEEELKKPAEVRVIVSSIQFSAGFSGWEGWSAMPREQAKMVATIRKANANGVVFISGDRHYAELSKFQGDAVYPLFDLTSSGLTQTWDKSSPNDRRLNLYNGTNYGMIEVDWKTGTLTFSVKDEEGKTAFTNQVALSQINMTNAQNGER